MKFFPLLLSSTLMLSCATPYSNGSLNEKGKKNAVLSLIKPLTPKRFQDAHNNSVVKDYRAKSDCQPFCPTIDVWLYEYRSPNGSIIKDTKPITSQKAYWKNSHEARIMAVSLFGKKSIYLDGMVDYFKSFQHIKKVNEVNDPVWGYETFSVRLYIPKRNPKNLQELGESTGVIPDEYIQTFLNLGAEIAYVDNGRKDVGVDAFFWRFLVAAEEMPAGESIRYLIRDADWTLTAGELFAVADWIDSPHQFHRMNMAPICIAPVTGSAWGGRHQGNQTLFKNILTWIESYPYHLNYGDDELFIRDRIWPHMKNSGSILTHHYPINWQSFIANPYQGSCEQPTQQYCNSIKLGGHCEDRIVPPEIKYPIYDLGMRKTLVNLKKDDSNFNLRKNLDIWNRIYHIFKA